MKSVNSNIQSLTGSFIKKENLVYVGSSGEILRRIFVSCSDI